MKTLFLLALLVVLPTFTYAMSYCTDNTTLIKNITYNDNGNSSFFEITDSCVNGCDNITASCSPAPYEANLMNMGLIIAIIVGIVLLWRYARR